MTNKHNDRNFDGLVERFEQRIANSTKGHLRQDLVEWQLQQYLPELFQTSGLNILDAAGGLGQMTQLFAIKGHSITYVDISADMQRRAKQRIRTSGFDPSLIDWHHNSIQSYSKNKAPCFDVILCHALLEWLAEPKTVLEKTLSLLKPGGKVSLLFYNRHALVLKNAMVGNIDILLPNKHRKSPRRKGLSPPNAQYPHDVLNWFEQWKYEQLQLSGIRVLYDWMPAEQSHASDYETILAIEKHYCQQPPYQLIGRYSHALFRKPV